MVTKNVLSCLLKDGKEVNAVMLVGRLFHARARTHDAHTHTHTLEHDVVGVVAVSHSIGASQQHLKWHVRNERS